ncbi:MAG: hypothetical protein ACFFAN_03135 [Promethearchaeota archaeon]
MTETENESNLMENIKNLIEGGKIDAAVDQIAIYLNKSDEENYINRLENVLEVITVTHGGRTVIRFLIEKLIIDIPHLLENLSKKDALLRYSFLLLLKSICENECDLFFPYSEDLLQSDDPNVREADLQLLIFMASGEKKIDQESLIKAIALKLNDEKDFVVQKAIQALIAIGKNSPSIVTRIVKDIVNDFPDNEDLKKNVDAVLKSIVSIEKIEEIVEEEVKKENHEELIEPLEEIREEPSAVDLEKEEEEIIDKEIKLKKKELEIKKKKLELEEKERKLQEMEIEEKERTLKLKEKLIEKEKELSKVELELKQKKIEEKKDELLKKEAKRIEKILKEAEKKD